MSRNLAMLTDKYKYAGTKKYVIFEIIHFYDEKAVIIDKRNGSEHDSSRLKRLFDDLGFERIGIEEPIIEHQKVDDYSLSKFNDKLNKVKKNIEENKNDIDMLVVIVLSHGKEDSIQTSDCQYIEIEKIIKPFKGTILPGKPKLFIFQACRGDYYVEGKQEVTADFKENDESSQEHVQYVQELDWSKIPLEADMLVAHSTIAGCVSNRHTFLGSVFIFFLYQVFITHSHELDVATMLTLVNRLVESKCVSKDEKTGKYFKQMPSFKSRLTKKLFLSQNKCSLKFGPMNKSDIINNEDSLIYSMTHKLNFTENDLIRNRIMDYPPASSNGVCLIFNQQQSVDDVNRLRMMFTETLGYSDDSVIYKENSTKKEILDTLSSVLNSRKIHSGIKCFVVIILTKGEGNKIWAADDQMFAIDNLVHPVNQCLKISKIPKLFFIQAEGLNINSELEQRNYLALLSYFSIWSVMHSAKKLVGNLFQWLRWTEKKQTMPSEKDMLFMFSNVQVNSFVQHFCNTVEEAHPTNHDIVSLLTVVNRKIMEEIMDPTTITLEGTDMPCFVSRLTGNAFLSCQFS